MSAIDPVKSITRERQEVDDVAVNLRGPLARLAALAPSTEAPYLTVSLDWRPDGTDPRSRPGRRFFDQQAERLLDGPEGRSAATESLRADVDRVAAFLDGQDRSSAEGIVIVACHAAGVFEAVPLGLPVPDAVDVGPTPSLTPLARTMEDHPTYAVVQFDQKAATLSIITQARRQATVGVRSTGFPVRQNQGGWSQQRYQNRADERIEHFLGTVAEETRKALGESANSRIEMLVLVGDDQNATLLRDTFHETIRNRIVGHVNLPMEAGWKEIVDATLPIVDRAERQRELAAVAAVREGAGGGGKAVTGVEETLTALQAGQVQTLVMNDDFSADGWADYALGLFGVGEVPGHHPAAGDTADLTPVLLETEMVRLALQFDAEIEIVSSAVPVSAGEQAHIGKGGEARPRSQAAHALDALGSVGAVLRFVLDADQSTANL